MFKLKTNKGTRKRFRISKKGKLKRFKPGKRHLLTNKSSNKKRHMGKSAYVGGKRAKITKKLLPYG